jgi:hypothetical protein
VWRRLHSYIARAQVHFGPASRNHSTTKTTGIRESHLEPQRNPRIEGPQERPSPQAQFRSLLTTWSSWRTCPEFGPCALASNQRPPKRARRHYSSNCPGWRAGWRKPRSSCQSSCAVLQTAAIPSPAQRKRPGILATPGLKEKTLPKRSPASQAQGTIR